MGQEARTSGADGLVEELGELVYRDPVTGRSVVFAFVVDEDPEPAAANAPIVVPWLDADGRYDVIDRTPGRSATDRPSLSGGALDWPTGDAPVASVVELIPRPLTDRVRRSL